MPDPTDPVDPSPQRAPEPGAANAAEESTAEVLARADAWAREGRLYDAIAVYRSLALRVDWERGRLAADLARHRPTTPPPVPVPSPQGAAVAPVAPVAPEAPEAPEAPAGLADRRQVDAFVADLPDATLTMLIVDVDRLQRINEGWSRAVGDAVLAQCVGLLRAQSRPQDILTRLNGAEFAAAFVVIFGGPVSLTRATLVAERLRAAVERHDWSTIAAGLAVTASVGVAACAPGEALDGALVRGHAALAECKRTGRNQVRCAT